MKHFWLFFALILAASLTRLIPHPWNVTPVTALALFAGANIPNKVLASFVAIVSVFLTDFVLGFYPGIGFVYGAVLLVVFLGQNWTSQKVGFNKLKLVGFSLSASMIFFIVSNFGVWLSSGLYAKTASGLVECYLMAVPFFYRSIMGDLFFTAILWGTFIYAERFLLRRQPA